MTETNDEPITNPDPADVAEFCMHLHQYNTEKAGPFEFARKGVFVCDEDGQMIVGLSTRWSLKTDWAQLHASSTAFAVMPRYHQGRASQYRFPHDERLESIHPDRCTEVFVGNTASERALQECRFVREEVLRQHCCKDDQFLDAVIYGRIAD